jgi:hypothetical protein
MRKTHSQALQAVLQQIRDSEKSSAPFSNGPPRIIQNMNWAGDNIDLIVELAKACCEAKIQLYLVRAAQDDVIGYVRRSSDLDVTRFANHLPTDHEVEQFCQRCSDKWYRLTHTFISPAELRESLIASCLAGNDNSANWIFRMAFKAALAAAEAANEREAIAKCHKQVKNFVTVYECKHHHPLMRTHGIYLGNEIAWVDGQYQTGKSAWHSPLLEVTDQLAAHAEATIEYSIRTSISRFGPERVTQALMYETPDRAIDRVLAELFGTFTC